MNEHKVVNRKGWADAREQLLVGEKEHTRLGDELARQPRKLLWVRIEKEYRFETNDGTSARWWSCSTAAVSRSLVGLGILIVLRPSSVPGFTPPM
jgi:predicted dithiol-disulfide oxidoreductase (DUF899 family)